MAVAGGSSSIVVVAVIVTESVAPSSSVTVRVTGWSPAVANVWVVCSPMAVAPPPKFQAHDSTTPSVSPDADPSNVQANWSQATVARAVGGSFTGGCTASPVSTTEYS